MKGKVIIQLAIVLVLGFFLGFLTHSTIMSSKIKNYSWRRGEVAFWSQTLKMANATPEQYEQIMPIVVKYSEKGHELMRDAFREVEPIWEEMEKEIEPYLNSNQITLLEAMKKKRLNKFRDRTKRGDGRKEGGRNSDKGQREAPHKK